jgi:hypothetical protein
MLRGVCKKHPKCVRGEHLPWFRTASVSVQLLSVYPTGGSPSGSAAPEFMFSTNFTVLQRSAMLQQRLATVVHQLCCLAALMGCSGWMHTLENAFHSKERNSFGRRYVQATWPCVLPGHLHPKRALQGEATAKNPANPPKLSRMHTMCFVTCLFCTQRPTDQIGSLVRICTRTVGEFGESGCRGLLLPTVARGHLCSP